MSGGGGGDRFVSWCFNVLLATIALYCAVCLIESMLPALIVMGGVLGVIALLVGVIVVIRTWRQRW